MPRAPWRSQENDPPILKPTGPGLAMARSLGDHVCKRVGGHAERSVWGASELPATACPERHRWLVGGPPHSRAVAERREGAAARRCAEAGPKLGRSWAEAGPKLLVSRIRHASGTQVGVIPTPVVQSFDVTPEDALIVIASDGVWEFISNEEAIAIVSKHASAQQGCVA